MKKLLIIIGFALLACLFFPLGWWILAFAIGFIVAIFELIISGIGWLFSSIGLAFAAANIWMILAIIFIILIIIVLVCD